MRTPPWFRAAVAATRKRRRMGLPERVRRPRVLTPVDRPISGRLRLWRRLVLIVWLPLTIPWYAGWAVVYMAKEMKRDWPKIATAWRR